MFIFNFSIKKGSLRIIFILPLELNNPKILENLVVRPAFDFFDQRIFSIHDNLEIMQPSGDVNFPFPLFKKIQYVP